MKKFLSLALAALMTAGCLVGCGSAKKTPDGIAVEGDTIKVGVFEPVTGENGGGGSQEVLGIRYANKQVPSVTIGDKEYKIELVEVDNQSDKTAAVTARTAPAFRSRQALRLRARAFRLSDAPAPTRRLLSEMISISAYASSIRSRAPSWRTTLTPPRAARRLM